MAEAIQRPVLYFTNEEEKLNLMILLSGMTNEKDEPMYHCLIETLNEQGEPVTLPCLYDAEKIKEVFKKTVYPSMFEKIERKKLIL